MGFSSWPYAATAEAVDDTYRFISENADVYSEHIDANIPWNAWINELPLPEGFINDIEGRKSRKIDGKKLAVSVSLLNIPRNELAFDIDGTVPHYGAMDDKHIEDAYVNHLHYIIDQLEPDYLIAAIEVNELLLHSTEKWGAYKTLMSNVRSRVKAAFPDLPISESITLHTLYKPDMPNPQAFSNEIISYVNTLEFAAISFYPYFKMLRTESEFQEAFDFLHHHIEKPIAFSETSHISNDLHVASINLTIPGTPCEQNTYLESLLKNAREQNYLYLIWWAHRDYDELWKTFPDDVKELGRLWLNTGIINEDGVEKEGFSTWKIVLNK